MCVYMCCFKLTDFYVRMYMQEVHKGQSQIYRIC